MDPCTDRPPWTAPTRRCGWPSVAARRRRRAGGRHRAAGAAGGRRGRVRGRRAGLGAGAAPSRRPRPRAGPPAAGRPVRRGGARRPGGRRGPAHAGLPAGRARPRRAGAGRGRPGPRRARRPVPAAPGRWPSAVASCSTSAVTPRRSTTTAGAAGAARRGRHVLGLPGALQPRTGPRLPARVRGRGGRPAPGRQLAEELGLRWRSASRGPTSRSSWGCAARRPRRSPTPPPPSGASASTAAGSASCWSTVASCCCRCGWSPRRARVGRAGRGRVRPRGPRHEAAPRPGCCSPRPRCSTATPAAALPHARRAAQEFARQRRPEWAALARLAVLRARCAEGRATAADARAAAETADALRAARWLAAALDARILAATLLRCPRSPRRGRRPPPRGRADPAERAGDAAGPGVVRRGARPRRRRQPARRPRGDPHRPAPARRAQGRPGRHRRARTRRRAPHRARGARPADRAAGTLAARGPGVGGAGSRHRVAHAAVRPAARRRGGRRRSRRAARHGRRDHRTAQCGPRWRGRRAARAPDRAGTAHPRPRAPARACRLERCRPERCRPGPDHRPARTAAGGRRPHRRPWATRHCWSWWTPTACSSPSRWPPDGSGCTGSGRWRWRTTCSTASPSPSPACCVPLSPARRGRRRAPCSATGSPAPTRPSCRPCRNWRGGRWSSCPRGRCRTCRGHCCPPAPGRPVTVSPSATLWLAARSRVDDPGHVLVAAGPALPGADAEARAVAAVHHVAPVLAAEATAERVLRSIDGAAMVHLATHGRLVPHNPLFSQLLLADGPLFAYDVERLAQAPHTVVLAACESGRSVVCAGDELLGLGAMFLARGSSQLVASPLPVPDAETAPLMTAFHRGVAAGRPVAEALAQAQQEVRGAGDGADVAAGSFVCVGSGFGRSPAAAAAVPAGAGADRRQLTRCAGQAAGPVAHSHRCARCAHGRDAARVIRRAGATSRGRARRRDPQRQRTQRGRADRRAADQQPAGGGQARPAARTSSSRPGRRRTRRRPPTCARPAAPAVPPAARPHPGRRRGRRPRGPAPRPAGSPADGPTHGRAASPGLTSAAAPRATRSAAIARAPVRTSSSRSTRSPLAVRRTTRTSRPQAV